MHHMDWLPTFLAAADEAGVKQKCLAGIRLSGKIVVLLLADYMIWNENNVSVLNPMGIRNSGRNADKYLWILTPAQQDGWPAVDTKKLNGKVYSSE